MSFFSYALGTVVLILVLLRQVRVRPVPRVFQPRLPDRPRRHRRARDVLLRRRPSRLVQRLALGRGHPAGRRPRARACSVASPCGCGPATAGCCGRATPSPWRCGWCRCWCTSPGDAGSDHAGAAGLEGASFLLYLGVTLAVQYYVVYRRALPLWAQLGPDAGRPLQVHFTQGPGAFFATFGTGSAGRPARMGRPPGRADAGADDADVIDAEVVEDDDDHGPPELSRAPLIVPTLGGRDDAPQLQPAALRRPARLDRAVAGPPRRVGRLPRGRVLRARRGPGRPAALRGGPAPGRAGGAAPGPGALRRASTSAPCSARPRRRRPWWRAAASPPWSTPTCARCSSANGRAGSCARRPQTATPSSSRCGPSSAGT